MKIKNLTITSPSALDLELDIISHVCLLYGEHSELALDLVRELIGDYGAKTNPDCYGDGHFVIHSDVEMDGKNYNVCYIRNADFIGDNRIAANFVPNSFEFSEDDTLEFLEKYKTRNKDLNNVVHNYKIFSITEDDRPLFVYCENTDDVSQVLKCLVSLGRQTFVAVDSNNFDFNDTNIQTVFLGEGYMPFLYYNAHPYQLEVDDCVKRSTTVTTGMDYIDVQRGLNQHKKITGAKKFNTDGNPRSYVENILGFSRVAISKKSDGTRVTANDFCKEHPKGRFIISMSGHWSAVINGTIFDTWDCGNEGLYSYYEVTPIKRNNRIPIRYGFIIRRESNNKASVSFYNGNGSCCTRTISAEHIDGYRACLLDMGKHEAIDWEDERWK